MSFKSIIKWAINGDKYREEKEKMETWKREQEERINNSPFTKKVAELIFANSNMPSEINITAECVFCSDGSIKHISFSELGVCNLNRSCKRHFNTSPSEMFWKDSEFSGGSTAYIDEVELFAKAICNCDAAKRHYHLEVEDMNGYGYDRYKLVRNGSNLSSW